MRLKQVKNMEMINQVEEKLRDEKDEEKIMSLMRTHKALVEQKKEFAKATGTHVYRPL
jgi:hypothetical protein